MRKASTWTMMILGILLVLLLAAVLSLRSITRAPLPSYEGEARLPGADGDIEIIRDEHGIPSIFASTDEDLVRAQGYVHAQDRFFQMDYRRHVTGGRLSELVGDNEEARQADIVIRAMGWRAIAEEEWARLDEETRGIYEAYAEGVNAYLAERTPGELALEYRVLGLQLDLPEIAPWDPIDSLAWLKAMAWDLKNNLDEEAARVRAYAALGDAELVEEMFPVFDYDSHDPILVGDEGTNLDARPAYPRQTPLEIPAPVAAATPTAASARADDVGERVHAGAEIAAVAADAVGRAKAALDGLPELLGRGPSVGSNSFVVAGRNTASGEPLLANDPHLTISYPSVWHQVGLHCRGECTLDVAGFSFAGMPGVVIGRNADIAWGLTNLGGDVTDFVVEKNLDENHYDRDGEAVPYEVRTEEFQVAGGEPFTVEIRQSVHGPIISDLLLDDEKAAALPGAPDDLSVALEWTALRPGESARAVMALNRASTPEEIAEAAALFEVPAQNIVFATRDGHIGYQAPGRFPVRPVITSADQSTEPQIGTDLGADGRWPRPGWDSAYDWQGYWASADMPASLDPPAGYIVAANQTVTEADLGPYLGSGHDAGFRATQIADEITERLEAGEKIAVADAEEIMLADSSPFGELLTPHIVAAEPLSETSKQAQEILADWVERGTPAGTDEPGMTIMSATYAHLLDRMFTARIDGFVPTNSSDYLQAISGFDEDAVWWDDPDTGEVEGRSEALAQALEAAVEDLHSQLGGKPESWRWGLLHRETPTHDILGGEAIPGPIRNYFNGLPRQVPGGSSIPNAMGFSPALVDGHVDFEVGPGPSMRMVVDMGGEGRWIVSSGVSGHPASPHVDDQLDMWATGQSLPWRFGDPEPVTTLRLTP